MADSVLSITLIGAERLKKAFSEQNAFAANELAKALNKAANDARQEALKI
jgi:hypothetical protein